MHPKKKRVLIIGLDGFTWHLAKPLIENGTMPFLGRMVEKGSHGELHSVMPYETSPAWISFQTGRRSRPMVSNRPSFADAKSMSSSWTSLMVWVFPMLEFVN